jgi:translation initiation factor 3 subunit A
VLHAEREEKERLAQELREAEEREYAEKLAKLEAQAERQRQREREIEERQRQKETDAPKGGREPLDEKEQPPRERERYCNIGLLYK